MKFLTLEYIKQHSRLDYTSAEDEVIEIYANSAEDTVLNLCRRTENEIKKKYGAIPAPIIHAALMLVDLFYQQRASASTVDFKAVPFGLALLLRPYMKLSDCETTPSDGDDTPEVPEECATKEWVREQIADINQFEYEAVDELPTASAETMDKIYLVPSTDAKEGNVKDEYITIRTSAGDGNNEHVEYRWEKIGSTDVDLSEYAKEDTVEAVAEDVGEMQKAIGELIDNTFPITISLSASKSGMNSKITFSVTEQGVKYVPDTITLTQTSFKQITETTTFDGIRDEFEAASGDSLTIYTPIKANRETFSLFVSSSGRTPKSTSVTRYICYSGASSKAELDASDIESMTMAYATEVAFNPSVTTGDNQYMYVLVPSVLSINKITSSGVEVTLDGDVSTISTTLGVFKVYRTANSLTANTWNLVIS